MAQIEVGLGAIVRDKDFAMLQWRHRARIDVDVGVHLEHRDLQAARFKQGAERRRRKPLAEGRNDATGHEDEFRFTAFHANSPRHRLGIMRASAHECSMRVGPRQIFGRVDFERGRNRSHHADSIAALHRTQLFKLFNLLEPAGRP